MARLIPLILALGLSGLPAGSLLCGLSCAPETPASPSCHEHGGATDDLPALQALHLCDQDASAPLLIAPSAHVSVWADAGVAGEQPSLSCQESAGIARSRAFSPGAQCAALLPLRI